MGFLDEWYWSSEIKTLFRAQVVECLPTKFRVQTPASPKIKRVNRYKWIRFVLAGICLFSMRILVYVLEHREGSGAQNNNHIVV
jgi:hypothetical protein